MAGPCTHVGLRNGFPSTIADGVDIHVLQAGDMMLQIILNSVLLQFEF